MKKSLLVAALVVALCAAIYVLSRPPAPAAAPVSAPAAETRAADPRNASVVIDGRTVTLKDGMATAGGATLRSFGNEARGDFDGDGTQDVAFVFTSDGGGSGTFFYAAVALGGGRGAANAVLLGDRIAPQSTEFQDGLVIVNYADRKPGEPMTAKPTVGVSKYLKVQAGRLVEVAAPSK